MYRLQSRGNPKVAETAALAVGSKQKVTKYDLADPSNLYTPVNVFSVLRPRQELIEKRLVFSAIARESKWIRKRVPWVRVNLLKSFVESVWAEGYETGTWSAPLIDNENR